MPYYCYLVRCVDESYYCGWTTDLQRRVNTHNKGQGSCYTRMRRPVALVYFEEMPNRTEAMKRELKMKKLTHSQKHTLVERMGFDAL